MSRRANGFVGIWAEAQRQQQRRVAAQARYQREQERQQRVYQRDLARSYREQRAAYRQQREMDARRRTEELDARVEVLRRLLAEGCRAPAFSAEALTRPEEVEAFSPGGSLLPCACRT